MSGGYLMPSGELILDEGQETSPAAIPVDSPCGQAQTLTSNKQVKAPIQTTNEEI